MDKKYFAVNCHYDMVVTVDVAAESEKDAIEQAKSLADYVSIDECAECYDSSACIADESDLTEDNQKMVEKSRIELEKNYDLETKIRDEYNRISENEDYVHIDDITAFAKDVLQPILDHDDMYEDSCYDFEDEFHDALRELIVKFGAKYYKKLYI